MWDETVLCWQRDGLCGRAAPWIELARLAAAKKLRSKLHKLCAKAGCPVPVLAFERWQARCKLWEADTHPSGEEAQGGAAEGNEESGSDNSSDSGDDSAGEGGWAQDPLLPSASDRVDEGFVADLTRAGMPEALPPTPRPSLPAAGEPPESAADRPPPPPLRTNKARAERAPCGSYLLLAS